MSHNQRIEEIEAVVKSWPVGKSFDHVLKWLMQFDTEDIDLGVRIIKNLNVIDFEDLNTSLSIAYSKLERVALDKEAKISSRNTLFAGIGDGAKSGAMMGYNFRIVNELPEDNFMTEESIDHLESGLIENIVLIDDIIGTGDQATREIKSLTEKVTPFGVKNIFLLTAVGMHNGIKDIINNTKAYVFSAFEYSELDTVANLDSVFYENVPHEHREKLRTRLEYYGRVSNRAALGYGGIGALIVFYYNTPNISLPVIWGSRNSWIPLFKRAIKINGINSYYKQMESTIAKKKRDNKPIQGKENELILIVESRIDEAFFEFVLSTMASENPFEKTNIISVGGYGSKTLIDNIARLSPNCLFIVEEDDQVPQQATEKSMQIIAGHEYLSVKIFEHFLDIDRLSQDDKWARFFQRADDINEIRNRDFMRRSMMEIRRRILTQPSFQHEFFSQYTDQGKLKILRDKLLEKFKTMAESGRLSKQR